MTYGSPWIGADPRGPYVIGHWSFLICHFPGLKWRPRSHPRRRAVYLPGRDGLVGMDTNVSALLVRRRGHELTQEAGDLLVGIQRDCRRNRRAATLWIDVDRNLRRCTACCKRQARKVTVSIG